MITFISLIINLSFTVLVHYRSQMSEDRLEQDRPFFMPTYTYSTLLISLYISIYTGLYLPFIVTRILYIIYIITYGGLGSLATTTKLSVD